MMIGKLEVARRQIITAIKLYFDDADSVSVCTLASAAGAILTDLHDHQKTSGFVHQLNSTGGETAIKLFHAPRNFFKHADRDPDAEMDFNDARCREYLAAATLDYLDMNAERQPIELQLFYVWFFGVHPTAAGAGGPCEAGEVIRKEYPDLLTASAARQKAIARELMAIAYGDPEIFHNRFTDRTPSGAF